MVDFRIGLGYDVHALKEGCRLIIGGVEIPHTKGFTAHSDGDLLAHAVSDALLGALAMGDIGMHFPDNDAKYRDADSMKLLGKVMELVAKRGYKVVNLDSTIMMQQPKLRPHIDAIRGNIAELLGVEVGVVSVKATTEEWLGFTGREEGAAAQVIVMLVKEKGEKVG